MFTPEIAKKAKFTLDHNVEKEFKMLLDDLIAQTTIRIKGDSSDLELRMAAVKLDVLGKLKDYQKHIKDAVERHGFQ